MILKRARKEGTMLSNLASNAKDNNCDTRFEMTTLSFNLKDYIQTII